MLRFTFSESMRTAPLNVPVLWLFEQGTELFVKFERLPIQSRQSNRQKTSTCASLTLFEHLHHHHLLNQNIFLMKQHHDVANHLIFILSLQSITPPVSGDLRSMPSGPVSSFRSDRRPFLCGKTDDADRQRSGVSIWTFGGNDGLATGLLRVLLDLPAELRPPVLGHVIGSVAKEEGDLAPPRAELGVSLAEDVVFCRGPCIASNVRVEVLIPPLLALADGSARQVRRDCRPIGLGIGSGCEHRQKSVLVWAELLVGPLLRWKIRRLVLHGPTVEK
jgi:hypothetical protein